MPYLRLSFLGCRMPVVLTSMSITCARGQGSASARRSHLRLPRIGDGSLAHAIERPGARARAVVPVLIGEPIRQSRRMPAQKPRSRPHSAAAILLESRFKLVIHFGDTGQEGASR